jgi:uncharacterized protein
MLKELISNPVFLTIIYAGVGTQLIKIIIFSIKYKRLHPLDLVATGGMPSAHSSLMVGLTTILYLTEGLSSLFFVTLALTTIVITDALGVRRTAGEEGLLLHKIIKHTKLKIKEPHYALGHSASQVIVGSIIGFGIALIVSWL